MKQIAQALVPTAAWHSRPRVTAEPRSLDPVKQRGVLTNADDKRPGAGLRPARKSLYPGKVDRVDVDYGAPSPHNASMTPKVKTRRLTARDSLHARQTGGRRCPGAQYDLDVVRADTQLGSTAPASIYYGRAGVHGPSREVTIRALNLNDAAICVQQGTTNRKLNLGGLFPRQSHAAQVGHLRHSR